MNVRTITGNSIKEAKTEASLLYGNDFVILESNEPNEQSHASVVISLMREQQKQYQKQKKEKHLPNEQKPEKEARPEPQISSFFKPFVDPIHQLIEIGNDTFRNLLDVQTESDPKPARAPAETEALNKSEGVSFIKSGKKPKISMDSDRSAKQEEAKPVDFNEQFKSRIQNYENSEKIIPMVNRRLQLLEQMVWNFTEDQHTHFSSHSLYQYLKKLHFRPEILIDWFDRWEKENKQSVEKNTEMTDGIRQMAKDYFQVSDPLSASRRHLFSSFSGTNITDLIAAIVNVCRSKGMGTNVGLIFSNSYDSDDAGIQMTDYLKSCGISCQSIVTHQDWDQFMENENENQVSLLLTVPLLYNIHSVEEQWDLLKIVLGEYHTVKHHFVTHSLIDPLEVISQLPVNHPFNPDLISLLNFEMCRKTFGRLTSYKEVMNCEFGFFHSHAQPVGIIDNGITDKIFMPFYSAKQSETRMTG
ncbi:MAG: hypothetical protein WEA56_08935 [Balneolaceae bacterium]